MSKKMPIGSPIVKDLSLNVPANPDEGGTIGGLAIQNLGGGNIYLDWSKIWGIFNGQYYKILALIGGRGVGKTYGAWEYLLRQHVERGRWNKYDRFIWFRTTDAAIAELKAQTGQKMCPYDQLKDHFGIRVTSVGNNIYFRDVKGYDGQFNGEAWDEWKKEHPNLHVGYALSLSTFYKMKGVQYNEVSIGFLDEVNREKGERRTFDLFYAFVNQIETVARLRQDFRLVLMGNTIDDASDILSEFNFIPPTFGTYRLRGHRTIIMYVKDSDKFAEARKESIAYALSGGKMASLNNELNNSEMFKPSIFSIHHVIRRRWVYRFYVDRDTYFDLWQYERGKEAGLWIGRLRDDSPPATYTTEPTLDGVIRYNRNIHITLKKFLGERQIAYQSMPIANQFVRVMSVIGSLK